MKYLQFILTLCVLLLSGSFLAQSAMSAVSCCNAPGDANDDGSANVGDAVYLISYVFKGGPAPPCMEQGDANGDGQGNVGDAVYLISFVFKGGPAPVCRSLSNVVFDDEYGPGATYEAFEGSFLEAVQVTADSVYAGTQGLEITIPEVEPWWSGGAFTDSVARDLSRFNALTFYARASMEATLNVAGIANDNTGNSLYMAEVADIALTTTWQYYVIPFPLPEKLHAERGLFYYAEGTEEGSGYQIWIDEIIFDSLTTITNPRPEIVAQTINALIGDTVEVGNGTVTFDVGGTDMAISAMPGYFTFYSSNPSVVSVSGEGIITAEGEGTATLTADLGPDAATGEITVNVSAPPPEPTVPAPTPTVDPDSVVSLFSDAYTNHPVDTWSADWDMADVEDYVIGSDNTKKYTNLSYAGIEFTTFTVDATAMSHFHMDVWTPDPTASPNVFLVKLVDFGANGVYGGGDDVEHELTFDENTMSTESWVSIDVPLVSFTGLTTTGHLAQLIISGNPNTVYVDNIYFYDSGLPTEPEVPAPAPTADQSNVVSLYSDAYTPATTINTWSAPWDQADVEDFVVGGDSTKKYTNLIFAGIEFTASPVDATAMTHFHMDVWTPVPTDAPAEYRVKLVDFGADGVSGGGDDVEHELAFDENTMNTGEWVGIDVPLTDFVGLTTTEHIAQMIISGDLGTIFVDNIYFYLEVPSEPTSPAPTPTMPSDSVVSLFSDAYTNHPVDTWSADWDMADVEDYVIGSDNTKKYTNLSYAGIEFTTTTLDASAMTHFHMDVWTPDATSAPSVFMVKLVDFGPDGAYGGDDDVEHELTFDENTMNTSSWVSIDVPLSAFTNLTTTGHLAQLIISGDPDTVYIDNVYFHQ